MTKKDTKIVEWALDELMKGDDGNTGNIEENGKCETSLFELNI